MIFHGYSIDACTKPYIRLFDLNGKVVFDGTIYHRVIIDATKKIGVEVYHAATKLQGHLFTNPL